MTRGIYQIRNLKTNRVYIGSSIDIELRIRAHTCALKKGHPTNKQLKSDCKKYGIDNFVFEIIEVMENSTEKELSDRERYWTDLAHTSPDGCYNPSRAMPRRGNPFLCKMLSCRNERYIDGEYNCYCRYHYYKYCLHIIIPLANK